MAFAAIWSPPLLRAFVEVAELLCNDLTPGQIIAASHDLTPKGS